MEARYAEAAALAAQYADESKAMNADCDALRATPDNRSGSKTNIPGSKRATGTTRSTPTDPEGEDKVLFVLILLFVAAFPIRSINALWKIGGARTVAVRLLSTPPPRSPRPRPHAPALPPLSKA